MPRIHRFIPCDHILEIAPGFGRWTAFLKDVGQQLTAVDLSESCIAHCRERFKDVPQVRCIRNDGKSLDMVPDGSVDFVFSFDSLVHAELDALDPYLAQLARKLKPDGVAFLHHSNARAFRLRFALSRRLPVGLRYFLMRARVLRNDHARAFSVSAPLVAQLCVRSGLSCVAQELINWGYIKNLDCLSTFVIKGSRWDRPNRVVSNPDFLKEARSIRRASGLYTGWGR